ncbi:PilZ domain-containing protein [Agarivorans litoreus]|uniref:PilZ domain-containing protein n=1 Tax=Agarivorans litoreus TaxID=1510455 RepID=UPI001C7D77F7|nr:PilZ domain-containing protein [Agarivorans litoreus]
MSESKHYALIERLLPILGSSDFNQVFKRATQDLPNNESFLLKMEINRLSTPCQRLVDLRGKVDGECQEFHYQGKTHYLDDTAIKVFKQQLKLYNQQYTLGIYEKLQTTENNFKVMQKKNISPQEAAARRPKNIIARAVRLGHYIGRSEERMHLTAPLRMAGVDGALFDAKTSNMSVSGLRAKVDSQREFSVDEHYFVYFTGLEKEFVNRVLSAGTEYKVVGIDRKGQQQWVRMIVVDPSEEFNNFFKNFLRSYRGRYKVDVDNITAAVITKGYEQYLMPRLSSVPLYFSGQTPASLRYALATQNNLNLLSYWRDETNHSHLSQLFHPPRMMRYQELGHGESLIFCFTHTANNRLFFYSASSEELAEHPDLRDLYLAFGCRKPSWKVFKFQYQPAQASDANVSSPLPKKDSPIERERVAKALDGLSMVGLLSDVTNQHIDQSYQQAYPLDGNPNKLSLFNQSKQPNNKFEQVNYKYLQLRKENRYQYRSLIEVEHQNSNETGWISDFSISGMKIEVETPLEYSVGDTVYLALPQFQKLVKSFELSHLAYEVTNCNNSHTIYNLKVIEVKGQQHQGSAFFKQLIDNNLDKLPTLPEGKAIAGLSDALRQIFCAPLFCRAMFIHKVPGALEVKCVNYGTFEQASDNWLNIDSSAHTADLSKFLASENLASFLATQLRSHAPSDNPEQIEVITVTAKKDDKLLSVRCSDNFSSVQQLLEFVRLSLGRGKVHAFNLQLSRVGRPDTEYIQRELDYISHYAIHRAKQLEDELWSVAGVIEVTDVTEELMQRFNLSTAPQPLKLSS